MSDVCGDNRFEVIAEAKKDLLESTNIEMRADEMAVIDNILFRCWQMGWLKQYETFEFCSRGDNPCKEYDQKKHCCHRWTKVIRQTVEEMRSQQPERRWIPVTEALPKDGQAVLCTVEGYPEGKNWTLTGCRYKDGVWEICEEAAYDYWTELSDVLAWMPLPEPWRGE